MIPGNWSTSASGGVFVFLPGAPTRRSALFSDTNKGFDLTCNHGDTSPNENLHAFVIIITSAFFRLSNWIRLNFVFAVKLLFPRAHVHVGDAAV